MTVATHVSPFDSSQDQLLAGMAYVDLRIRWAVARARAGGLNPDDEFRGLYISDDHVDTLLGYEFGHHLWAQPFANGHHDQAHYSSNGHSWSETLAKVRQQWEARTRASRHAGTRLLLDDLIQTFELPPPEVDMLLIALAPELDPRYERFFAYLQDDVTRKRPSVDLILNLLTHSFEEKLQLRSLLGDNGRLIQSRLLIHFSDNTARQPTLLSHYVRPAANVVEHLLGQPTLDVRLAESVQLLLPQQLPAPKRLSPHLLAQLLQANQGQPGARPLFAFVGPYGAGKREAAAQLAASNQQPLLIVDLSALANSEVGLQEGMRLVTRDGRLLTATLYVTQWETALIDGRPQSPLFQQLLAYPHTVVVASAINWQPEHRSQPRSLFAVRFHTPDYQRRLQLWQAQMGQQDGLNLPQVANHFRFTPGQIEDAVATAHDLAQWHGRSPSTEDLLAASRAHSNQNLATLATKIQPRYTWAELVLPVDTLRQLQEMVNTVRQRPVVYNQWGFGRKMALGKGLNALFAGESGTGKTMAADIMAGALSLDLYKVDLSTLISKYIGETEKNLDRIFTEAATSNAILFFDEADAIFGKRSEVKDSHDRYANIEISYLLQRMEAYDGVVILATNLRANLDEAFTRRLHFAVEFPFPEAADRERIWRVNFPAETPVAAEVNFSLLAQRFRLAGGNIRNIILAAAFLAAESEQPVGMSHLLHAARREYQKMGRLIDEELFTHDGDRDDQ